MRHLLFLTQTWQAGLVARGWLPEGVEGSRIPEEAEGTPVTQLKCITDKSCRNFMHTAISLLCMCNAGSLPERIRRAPSRQPESSPLQQCPWDPSHDGSAPFPLQIFLPVAPLEQHPPLTSPETFNFSLNYQSPPKMKTNKQHYNAGTYRFTYTPVFI